MKASEVRYLADAGPLVGLLSQDDQWHEWSARTLAVIDEPLVTTETALAEACHLVRRYRPALLEVTAMLGDGRLRASPVLSEQPQEVGDLLRKYPDMDAGDATLVVLSERFPRAKLITLDGDFHRYRRLIPVAARVETVGPSLATGLACRKRPPYDRSQRES